MTLTHEQWRRILLPVARVAVERGDFDDTLGNHKTDDFKREHHIGIIANYSATDMVLSGRTRMLLMPEVREAEARHLQPAIARVAA